MLNVLIAYLAIGVSCIPISFYTFYKMDETDRHEDPLVFWLVMLMICTVTVPLWPILLVLQINHFMVVWKSNPKPRQHSISEWIALEESWKKISALSDELNSDLSNLLDSDETQGDMERRIRKLLAQIEEEYDRWAKQKDEILKHFSDTAGDARQIVEVGHLREGPGWPRVKVSINVKVDPVTNVREISHSTVRTLFPEDLSEKLKDSQPSPEVLFRQSPRTQVGGEPHPWRVTISGRFNKSLKKLRGSEKEKVETAITDIILSPTTVLGDTKAPLSNNLRGVWRYRVGDWRIIYTVDKQAKTVTMLDYTHRSKVYR